MFSLPEPVRRLIEEIERLPGIGPKSAQRLALHLLQSQASEVEALARALVEAKRSVVPCTECYHWSVGGLCEICADDRRDRTKLCVVEQPRDLIALEQTGIYHGLYHVLLGRIAPLDGIGPDQLTIDALVRRVREGTFKELIMATNPTTEGDGTALYISNLVAELPIRVTRLARGITPGSVLEYANREILTDALTGRQEF